MADNPLYPTDSFEDRWGGLPVEPPRFNYTPNSSLIESEPRKEPFKLTPVNFNPFPENSDKYNVAPESLREVFSGYDKPVGRQQIFPERLARFVGKTAVAIPGALIRGATNPRAAFRGEFPVSDPETGMATEETVGRALETAALGGTGGLAGGTESGAIVGSGLTNPAYKFTPVEASTVSDAFKNRFLPNGVPKPEAFDRVLPAVRNLDTGKISTTKRGNEHATILDKLWEKQGGDPGVSTLELYENMLPKHEMGFYDPKNKQFFPRSHPDWQNIDSPDLNPKEAMKSAQVFSDTNKPGWVLAGLTHEPPGWDRLVPAFQNSENGKIYTAKRGEDHSSILHKLWDKEENKNQFIPSEPYDKDMLPIQAMVGKHNLKDGFYDPKTKTFHNREGEYDFDATALTPKKSLASGQTFYEDSSKPAQMLSALQNAKGQWESAAEKAGFTTDAYHGMQAASRKFQGDRLLSDEFYSTVEPKLASDYARNGNGAVVPLKLNTKDYHVVDAKNKDFEQINEKAIKEAKEAGKSGVTIHNVKDPYDDAYGFHEPTTIHIALDPSTVRSRFAKFNPEDIKKNGLLLSDTQKPGMVMAALHDAPTFYSAVEHAVNNIKQQKMPADQWLGTLNNAKGVKPEEMDWLGLKEHLQSKGKEPVTKQEIQDLVNQNKVELKEVNKSDTGKNNVREFYERNRNDNDLEWSQLTQRERQHWVNEADKSLPRTKFSKYQLPGGENYREKLLTLPNKISEEKYNEIMSRFQKDRSSISNKELEQAKQFEDPLANRYTSSHWPEDPNTIAHVRMNDRKIEAPGDNRPKRSLHIEEIQSDWHQAGRDKGYKTGLTPEETQERHAIYSLPEKVRTPQQQARMEELDAKVPTMGVPNAPFKKTWHELVLKRMIREAAEKGYDRISWTPGEAQAARYDLSRQVNNIYYQKNADGTYKLSAMDKQNRGHKIGDDLTEAKLADNVGKELAAKIIKGEGKKENLAGNNEKPDTWHKFEGLDLKVGGEGMKGFYDKMIPNAIEKIGKEHGVKVKQANVDDISKYTKHELSEKWKDKSDIDVQKFMKESNIPKTILQFIDWSENNITKKQPVHYIDIPESLKNVAMKKGFPLFSGGFQFSPIAGNPHEPVNNSNDVPYGAGASNTPSGYPVNIDKRIPQYDERLKTSDGRRADLHKYLTIHEINEYKAMKAGMPYEKAHHEIATKAEKAAVEADGVNWKHYEEVMDGYLKETEHENPKDPPSNLYKKPYAHDKKELNKMRKK